MTKIMAKPCRDTVRLIIQLKWLLSPHDALEELQDDYWLEVNCSVKNSKKKPVRFLHQLNNKCVVMASQRALQFI